MNRQEKKHQYRFPLAQKIQGLDNKSARALADCDITTLEDLRDADLDSILRKNAAFEFSTLERWQQEACLQTIFAGMTARAAEILVNFGIRSVAEMARVENVRLKKKLPSDRLAAWKFIAANIPATLVPEQLAAAREIDPLTPPQAVALYAHGIKTLQHLRDLEIFTLDFSLLPEINKGTLALYKYLATLRLNYCIGPKYAYQLYHRYHGNRDKIRQRLERESNKIPRTRGGLPSDVNAYLEPICRDLAATIGRNKPHANRALKRAQQWGSAQEISGKLLRALAEDRSANKAAVIPWLLKRGLTSKRGLLDLIDQAVKTADGKKDLIDALADRWGMGALINLGKDSELKDTLGNFLVNKLKQAASNWSEVSPEAIKLLKLGGEAAANLMDQFNLKPEKLISTVLKSSEREKESYMSTVLNCFQDKAKFDQIKTSTILELHKDGAEHIQPFLQHLYKSGKESFGNLDNLLQIPLAQSSQDRDGVFSSIFKAVSSLGAETEDGLDKMMPKLLDWLRRTNEMDFVQVVDDFLLPENKEAAVVPMGFHLLGKGLQSIMGESEIDRAIAKRFTEKFFQHLPLHDELQQEIWLHLAKIPDMLFVFLSQMLLKAVATPMKVFQWIGQNANAIKQKDRELVIKVLAPPDEANDRKYVILSDIHREVPEDDIVDEHFFDLSHFSKHRDLFIRVLEYYRDNGYIVIENGDCEELWVVPSVRKNKGVRARAERIIAPNGPHQRVYKILAELHRQGRYFRTRGNHDDFWAASPANEALLRDTWFNDGPEFRVWDALIIPEVLTMQDDYLGSVKKIIRAKHEHAPLDVKELADLLPIGLSPRRYRERKPLFILHGHQMDFWNCDEHNFLGRTLTNSIGIIADGISTFPYHLRGIDLDGNPMVKFSDLMAKVPQVEHWLPLDRALRQSRRIEQGDKERLIQDSIYYCETLAAALSLALKYPGQTGRQQIQIMVGHTHWPQSRPLLHLATLKVPGTDKKIPLGIQTPYYNSGTCGWWEGVLWGIEITSYGQPKLFYWDKSSQTPHFMPWELHDDIPEYVDRYKEKVGQFLAKCFNDTTVLEENTRNRVTWNEVDDFSELQKIDFGALDTGLHGAAMNTAQIWALRYLDHSPKTSQSLELSFNLYQLMAPEKLTPTFSMIAEKPLTSNLIGMLVKTLDVGREWKKIDSQNGWYHQIGSLFFYAAHFLKNSLCNKLGLLLNLFISQEHELHVRLDAQSGIFAIKLGNAAHPQHESRKIENASNPKKVAQKSRKNRRRAIALS